MVIDRLVLCHYSDNLYIILSISFSIAYYLVVMKSIERIIKYEKNSIKCYKEEINGFIVIQDIIKNDKLKFIIFLIVIIILQLFFSIRHRNDVIINIPRGIEALIIPFFEEYIYRKLFYDYNKNNNTVGIDILNVLLFFIIHFSFSIVLLLFSITMTFLYKTYKSLLINCCIHILYNLLGLLFPLLVLNFS